MPTPEDVEARLPKYVAQRAEVPRNLRALQPKIGEAQVALGSDLAALERALAEAFARNDVSATTRDRVRNLAVNNRKKIR